LSEIIVELKDVVFKRGVRTVIDGMTFSIKKHKLTSLMGPSGVGKTTILKLITGQEKPASGEIRVFGENIQKLNRNKLYHLRRRIGVLFQSGALLTDLNVFDNVALPLRHNTKLNERAVRDLVEMKLEAVGLLGATSLYPRELSGGMARRVSLARTLILDPELIMYDEPFVGQDPITMAVLVKLMDTVSKSLPITSIAISHDVEEILSIADYGYLLSQGKAVDSGTPEKLTQQGSEYAKQFLKGIEDGPVPFHFPNETPLKQRLLSG
jgi:phospholipid/cholesterol/gamma-HCH transport system ATP-binding protein